MPLLGVIISVIIYGLLTGVSLQRLQIEASHRAAAATAADVRLLLHAQENTISVTGTPAVGSVADLAAALGLAQGGPGAAPVVIPLRRRTALYEFVADAGTGAVLLRARLGEGLAPAEARQAAIRAATYLGGGVWANQQTRSGVDGDIEVVLGNLIGLNLATNPAAAQPYVRRDGSLAMTGNLDLGNQNLMNLGEARGVQFIQARTARMDTLSTSNFRYLQ